MIARILFAVALAFGLVAGAAAQPASTQRYTQLHKLRNVSAADAAEELVKFANQKRLDVMVQAETVSNAVLVNGNSAALKQVTAALASLDVQSPQILVRLTLVRVPAGFTQEVGLGTETKWVLTDRETNMLHAAIRREKGSGVEVLSEPTVMTTDNQSARVNVGDEAKELAITVTPRFAADGKIALAVEVQTKATVGEVANVQGLQTTQSVPSAGTLVVRGLRSSPTEGKPTEVIAVMTVERFTQQAK